MRKQMGMLTGGLLLVVVVVAGTLLWKPFSVSSERMSEDEIIGKVETLYPNGTITDTALDGDVYRVQLVSDQGKYDLAVDAREGSIVSIEQLEKGKGGSGNQDPTGQQPEPPDPDNRGTGQSEGQGQGQGSNPPPAPNGEGSGGTPEDSDDGEGNEPENPPMRMITREHAEKVSLAKVPGTIEDIEYREDDGVRYYLVEIEKSDGREATIQVHAITGKIMTVTWDD